MSFEIKYNAESSVVKFYHSFVSKCDDSFSQKISKSVLKICDVGEISEKRLQFLRKIQIVKIFVLLVFSNVTVDNLVDISKRCAKIQVYVQQSDRKVRRVARRLPHRSSIGVSRSDDIARRE